jgi:hypothetical protein
MYSEEYEPDRDEQWLLGGNCNICRRKKFCQKACTVNKRVFNARVMGSLMEATGFNQIQDAMSKSNVKPFGR